MPTDVADIDTRLFGRDVAYRFDAPWGAYWMVFLRVVAGWWFLNAGLDKVMHWPFDAGWFVAQEGVITAPLMAPFADGLGLAFVNVMIPAGQVLIGLGLIVGGLTRLAAASGATLMFFFYFGNADFAHGFVNGDLLGLLVFLTILLLGAGRVLGLDAWLEDLEFVQNYPRLRYLMG